MALCLHSLGLGLHVGLSGKLHSHSPLPSHPSRFVTLPNTMKAKKKTIESVTPEALGVDITPQLVTVRVDEPVKRKGGTKVTSAQRVCLQFSQHSLPPAWCDELSLAWWFSGYVTLCQHLTKLCHTDCNVATCCENMLHKHVLACRARSCDDFV